VASPVGVTVVAFSDDFRSRLGNDAAPIDGGPAHQNP
jgi:hypothetical protein